MSNIIGAALESIGQFTVSFFILIVALVVIDYITGGKE